MSPGQNGHSGSARGGSVSLQKHLQTLRVADLKDVHAFWRPDEDTAVLRKSELVERLTETMSQEGTVYRRVRTLTRKVLDVLLLLLRRPAYASDVPGLFQRLPGEDAFKLEYHEAEAGVRALHRRGFLAEVSDRGMATNGRVLYAVPEEIGGMLTALFREETRTVKSLFSLSEHAAAITATERAALRAGFPALDARAGEGDVAVLLADGGAPARIAALGSPLSEVVGHIVTRYGGLVVRGEWTARQKLTDVRWNREAWSRLLEQGGVGTLGRLDLKPYGIACEDEVLVVFHEVLEDLLCREAAPPPAGAEVLRGGGDLIADVCAFLEHVRRHPVKVSRDGEVHKTTRRRIEEGFVSRETFLAGPSEVWQEVHGAAEHLGLVARDDEGFLELRPEAERFLALPLEAKAQELHRLALEQGGTGGRSLHQREMRTIVGELLRESPDRWWTGRALASVARHRYLASLDERGIRERHRDRFFSAYFSGKETPWDLLVAVESHWLPRLFLLGVLDAATENDHVLAWRLSPLGARMLGAASPGLDTGLEPLLVNPDFEIVVLPEGDVSDVIHTLDRYAQRVKSGEVVHFRLTREAIEAAVVAGRGVDELLAFLSARSRGGVPQNVSYMLRRWAEGVTFAALERGVVLEAADEAALERILAVPEMARLLVRRLGPTEALLKDEPGDRRLVAALRERGIHLRGP